MGTSRACRDGIYCDVSHLTNGV